MNIENKLKDKLKDKYEKKVLDENLKKQIIHDTMNILDEITPDCDIKIENITTEKEKKNREFSVNITIADRKE